MDILNPWKVDSVNAFSFLKCPECVFDSKEVEIFQDHAIDNHPLSFVLFGNTEKYYKKYVGKTNTYILNEKKSLQDKFDENSMHDVSESEDNINDSFMSIYEDLEENNAICGNVYSLENQEFNSQDEIYIKEELLDKASNDSDKDFNEVQSLNEKLENSPNSEISKQENILDYPEIEMKPKLSIDYSSMITSK